MDQLQQLLSEEPHRSRSARPNQLVFTYNKSPPNVLIDNYHYFSRINPWISYRSYYLKNLTAQEALILNK